MNPDRAAKLGAFSTVVLFVMLALQIAAVPYHGSIVPTPPIVTGGTQARPWAVGFVELGSGYGFALQYFDQVSFLGLPVQTILTPARYAQAAIEGRSVPDLYPGHERTYIAEAGTYAYVWRTPRNLDSDEQRLFKDFINELRGHPYFGSEGLNQEIYLMGWAAGRVSMLLFVASATFAWLWWRGQRKSKVESSMDTGDLVQIAQNMRDYLARLRRLSGWLILFCFGLSALFVFFLLFAFRESLGSWNKFIWPGMAATLGTILFPMVWLIQRRMHLRREEARLATLAANPPV